MTAGPLVSQLAARNTPLRVGLIGAGKFGTMFLSQAHRIAGLHVLGVADLSVERAANACRRAGWPPEQYVAQNLAAALDHGSPFVTDDSSALIQADGLDVLVEATGDPKVGIHHALEAITQGRHTIMVNVEADALAGPLLAKRAAAAGLVYSLAYGDQPALICELVEWARSSGFDVICAGKGTKYLPVYRRSTPDTVWKHYGFSTETIEQGNFNPRMFNSFLDGTKSAIEMAAVANATGLRPQPCGLQFVPGGIDDLPSVCRPRTDGGQLTHKKTVEVLSSLQRDGTPVERDLRWGVYVTFEAPSDYVQRCFAEYGLLTDSTGRYAALYRPFHLVGLELTVSVLRAGLRGEATGLPDKHLADVVALAKRPLHSGEILDGEGGYCIYGNLMGAVEAKKINAVPIGMTHQAKLNKNIAANQPVRWSDIEWDEADSIVRFRREMEKLAEERAARGEGRSGASTDYSTPG